MDKPLRVVHYLNQFFGQVGGEDKAGTKPFSKEGPVGPGLAFAAAFADEATIVGTIICGDSYFNENMDEAGQQVLDMIAEYAPDVVIAGPAFNAGRYGVACGWVTKAVQERMQIPAVTGMYAENPGVEIYQKTVYIVSTSDSAAGMRKAVPTMANLALKLAKKEPLGSAEEEGFMERGAARKNFFTNERGAKRAVDMLIAKLNGQPFTTEYPMPEFDRVFPQPAIENRKRAKIALVTSGGIVPKGNPDRLEASSASKFGKYPLADLMELTDETHETAHGGYDPVYANQDPDRVVPLDVMRELEAAGEIGSLHPYFYSTVGNGTSVANAKRFAQSIAHELVNEGVQAVILTST
jgi:glycine reductase complex component B subunit gamma